ncbi:MAG TPA: branched-chain amino acid ABC transporter permease [Candidimonas sp.]|nr:branched-chain amino acid ABC transporter permease [Candidimonas sp.]
MTEVFGLPMSVIAGQTLLGLVNGCFYAVLSLGLAVIFGLLRIVNFAHGAFFMAGAFVAWMLQRYLGVGYWWALLLVPVLVGLAGALFERTLLRRLYGLDPIYGLLLTFGLVLAIEGGFRVAFGSSGQPYPVPPLLRGVVDLDFMVLPLYRVWVIVFALACCCLTGWLIEGTRLGATLRAATERPALTQSFGVDVPLLLTATYGAGIGLAALAGALAAPILHVNPSMGSDLIIVVFAIVVIGGMGSVFGSIATALAIGVIEGWTKVFYSEASTTVIFVVMALVLLLRPKGLFGREGAD